MSAMNDFGAFNFTFDPTLDTFDTDDSGAGRNPNDDIFLPNVEGRTEFLPPDPDRIPVIENAVKQDEPAYAARPAEERTRELFEQMRPHRVTLLGILDAARTPVATSQMEQLIEDISGRKFSVYSASNFCTMLECAGALERVNENGEPYSATKPEPAIVVIDGEEFYEPTYPPAICWQATEAGLAMVGEDDPAARIKRLFDKEPEYLPVYKRILTMANAEEGTQMALMSVAVDTDPAVSENRRFYVQHFAESLERAGAFEWRDGAWKTTKAGTQALETLADVVDDYEIPAIEDVAEIPTETDGVRW